MPRSSSPQPWLRSAWLSRPDYRRETRTLARWPRTEESTVDKGALSPESEHPAEREAVENGEDRSEEDDRSEDDDRESGVRAVGRRLFRGAACGQARSPGEAARACREGRAR